MEVAIPQELLELEVSGPGVTPGALGDVVSGGPTLLVFLRHFG